MMRVGKTKLQIEDLRHSCRDGKTTLVYGLKDPQHYLKELGGEYVAEPYYATPAESNRYYLRENVLTEYLPTIIGYIFSKR